MCGDEERCMITLCSRRPEVHWSVGEVQHDGSGQGAEKERGLRSVGDVGRGNVVRICGGGGGVAKQGAGVARTV